MPIVNPPKPKKEAKKEPKNPETYGGWHFARDFSTGVFGLLNTGRVFPAFGLLILVLMGLIIWKLPESDVAAALSGFFEFLRSSFTFAITLLVSSNTVWYLLYKKQKRLYEAETKRLSDGRSELLHLGSDQVIIVNHRSSEGAQAESYILPDSDVNNSKDTK